MIGDDDRGRDVVADQTGVILRKLFGPAPVPPKFAGFPEEMAVRPSQLRASAEESGLMVEAAGRASRHYRELDIPVAIVSGTGAADDVRRDLPRALLRPYAHWEPDAVDAVLNADVLAAYGDELEVQRVLGARVEAPLRLRASILPDTRDPIAVALPWDSSQLASWVDLYLETAAKPLSVDELLAPAAPPTRKPAE